MSFSLFVICPACKGLLISQELFVFVSLQQFETKEKSTQVLPIILIKAVFH